MKAKKLKILEITAFSAGICGVWARVLQEAKLLAKKHDVRVFSSNIKRGTDKKEKAKSYEEIENIKIHRFPTFASFGQNTYFWKFKKQALRFKPDIIITHAYRQYYSTLALRVAKKLKVPCILVTHAPFLEKRLRNWKLNLAVWLYDNLVGKKIINQYDRVISITKWEIPFLLNLGCKKDRIVYIPNGIPDEFFQRRKQAKKKQEKKGKTILFLGRVTEIKDLETLIKAFKIVKENSDKPDKKIKLKIVGPVEEPYGARLTRMIGQLRLNNSVSFFPPIYNTKEKIDIIDDADIFVLPSKREGMPQSLIEAMSRSKIVISSKTDGGKEMIKDGKNGFLFEIENPSELAEKILFCFDKKNKRKIQQIEKNAKTCVEQFNWQRVIKEIENMIKELVSE